MMYLLIVSQFDLRQMLSDCGMINRIKFRQSETMGIVGNNSEHYKMVFKYHAKWNSQTEVENQAKISLSSGCTGERPVYSRHWSKRNVTTTSQASWASGRLYKSKGYSREIPFYPLSLSILMN